LAGVTEKDSLKFGPFSGQVDTTKALKNCQPFWQMIIAGLKTP
jgi:hypothetical protein